MPIPFAKMQGCGNDYVLLDLFGRAQLRGLAALARAISDRHRGVGADGLILVGPSRRADLRMRIFNADGSEGEMCGNGLRLAAKLAWDRGRVRRRAMTVETLAGIRPVALRLVRGEAVGAEVDMGRPRLEPAQVPVRHPGPGPRLELRLRAAGMALRLLAVGMGNPHAVCFVPDPDRFPVEEAGPALERHPRFPRRANVHFAAPAGTRRGLPVLRVRTWERGSGPTLACGSGACAVLVAAILDRRIPGRAAAILADGGALEVSWPRPDAHLRLAGPAETAFEGVW